MVLGDSNVAFTEKNIGEKKPYSINYYQWLTLVGSRIIEQRTIVNTSVDVYEVPSNKVFYLFSIIMNGMNANNLNNEGATLILKNQINIAHLELSPESSDNLVSNFTYPLLFTEGEILSIGADATTQLDITIVGFEINKDIIFSQ